MVTLMKTSDLLHVGSSQSLKLDTLAIHLQKYFVSVAEDADGAHRGRGKKYYSIFYFSTRIVLIALCFVFIPF